MKLESSFGSTDCNTDYILIAKESKINNEMKKKTLFEKVTGKFYTPKIIGEELVKKSAEWLSKHNMFHISIIDPFCGDGRLIKWFLENLVKNKSQINSYKFDIAIWDIDKSAIEIAINNIDLIVKKYELDITISPYIGDTFTHFFETDKRYNVVLTNPPWIVLKPDVRDIKNISESKYQDYTKSLYSYSKQIETLYPISKPNNGWSGWGINLSRTGIEVAVSLMSKDGITGVVSPASLLADINSKKFREWLFIKHNCSYINYYPAECRLFKEVDQPSICMGITNSSTNKICSLIAYDKNLKRKHTTKINLNSDFFNQTGSVIPINLDQNQIDIFRTFSKFDLISKLEGKKPGELWIGRELDETGYVKRITPDGNIPFVKGRGIHRLDSDIVITGKMSEKTIGKIIPSIKFPRIVWRDVSRPTQKRRIQATLLPTGYLTGNSLGVMHFYENNQENLFTYLGLFSSIVFEFQIRAMLATGHISASTIKNAHIPNLSKEPRKTLSYLTQRILDKDKNAERELEIYVAKLYGLDKKQFKSILKLFTKINKNEQEELLDSKIWMNM